MIAMASYQICLSAVLLTILLINVSVSSERMKSKIYESIDGAAACFRRLNGTHQFGCTSHKLGNVGVVHFIGSSEDLTWLLQEGEAVPYMAVMYPSNFTRDVLLKLKDSNKVNGIALLNNGTLPDHFTHEDTCPNRYSGLFVNETCDGKNSQNVWNPYGTKLLLEDWGFPIFYVKKDIEKILKCYTKFNSDGRNKLHDRSLCALELSSFMFATVDSATCIRRSKMITNLNPMRFCDPLSSRNVWSTLFPRNKTTVLKNESVYVVATRMDTSSLFDGITPGAVSPVTGIVALLTTAHILSKLFNEPKDPQNKNVLFVLFNGESYDYIGSSRMVWDMKKGRFPAEEDETVPEQPGLLRLENLAYFIELSHLTNQFRGHDNSKPSLVFHSPEKNSVKSQVSSFSFIEEMKEIGSTFGLQFKLRNDGKLPPASLQTFIAESGNSVPGVVIADYYSSFTTRYYHSVFDDSNALQYQYQNGSVLPGDSLQSFVTNISTALALTLYKMLTGEKYDGPIHQFTNLSMVDELFHCYVEKMNCSLFQEVSYNMMLNDEPANLYIGVNSWRPTNYPISTLTGQALAYFTGDVVNKTEKECHNNPLNQIYQYIWMKGSGESGVCVKTTMKYSIALSPAFEEADYDWSSGRYSTWTESVWQELGVRVFLKPSYAHDVKILSIGALVFGLSFIIVYFLNSRSHILFGNMLGTGAC